MNLCTGVYAEEVVQEEEADVSVSSEEAEPLPEEAEDQECEWNVLIYLCGTDLESDYGAATKNLQAIAKTMPEESVNIFHIETDPEE